MEQLSLLLPTTKEMRKGFAEQFAKQRHCDTSIFCSLSLESTDCRRQYTQYRTYLKIDLLYGPYSIYNIVDLTVYTSFHVSGTGLCQTNRSLIQTHTQTLTTPLHNTLPCTATCSHAPSHARSYAHAHTRTHTHARTHAHTYARTHTQTYTAYVHTYMYTGTLHVQVLKPQVSICIEKS